MKLSPCIIAKIRVWTRWSQRTINSIKEHKPEVLVLSFCKTSISAISGKTPHFKRLSSTDTRMTIMGCAPYLKLSSFSHSGSAYCAAGAFFEVSKLDCLGFPNLLKLVNHATLIFPILHPFYFKSTFFLKILNWKRIHIWETSIQIIDRWRFLAAHIR